LRIEHEKNLLEIQLKQYDEIYESKRQKEEKEDFEE